MALFGRETERDARRAQETTAWVRQRNPFALASVVLGTFSLIELGVIPIFSVGAVILAVVALRQLNGAAPAQPFGKRLAWTGLALGSVALISGAILYIHRFITP